MMSADDWEHRYQTRDMPWEKGSGSPGLHDFLQNHPDLPRGSVLVPGCGTGHDVRTWAAHGFEVTGMDIAPSAIRLCQERTPASAGAIRFRCGDFLRETPERPFDWIFEHTLFCAINPAERATYVDAVQRWLKPGGQFLAVHYMIPDREGPPFGSTQAELIERFDPVFELRQGWIPRSYPNRTGLELMLWWERRLTPKTNPQAT